MAKNDDSSDDMQNPATETAEEHLPPVEFMLKAAEAAAQGNQEAARALQFLVLYCVNTGNDACIQKALAQADSEKVFDAIEETARMIAANAFNVKAPGTSEDLNVELFTIPVLLVMSGDNRQEVPRTLSGEDIDWLAGTFASYGLSVPEKETVRLAPQLWTATDIYNMPYSKVCSLAHAFGEAINNQTTVDMEQVVGANVDIATLEPGHMHYCLRYLVGVLVHKTEELLPFQTGEKEDIVDTWRREVGDGLSTRFGFPAKLMLPNVLYQGLEHGWMHFQTFRFAAEQSVMLKRANALPGEMTAVISLHAKGEEMTDLRVSYSRQQPDGSTEQIGNYRWPLAPFDNPTDITVFLKKFMEDNGIGEVKVTGSIEMEGVGDGPDGAPSPASGQTGMAAPSIPFPTSKYLH